MKTLNQPIKKSIVNECINFLENEYQETFETLEQLNKCYNIALAENEKELVIIYINTYLDSHKEYAKFSELEVYSDDYIENSLYDFKQNMNYIEVRKGLFLVDNEGNGIKQTLEK